MARVKVVGSAAVIVSDAKLDDLKFVSKYRPEALQLFGGDDNKTLEYQVLVRDSGTGTIDANGAMFAEATNTEDGLACITMVMNGVTGNVKEWISDKLGSALIKLAKIEENLPNVIEEVKAERDSVMANIDIEA